MITLIAREGVFVVLLQAKVRELIKSALSAGQHEYSFFDIVQKLEAGEFQLWFGHTETELKLLMITAVEVWPRYKRMRVLFIAGAEFDDYAHHLQELSTWAREHNCKNIVTQVRPGFEKKLKALGFETIGVNVSLSLET